MNSAQVSQVLKDSTEQGTGPGVTSDQPSGDSPLASRSTDILHDDIAFEVGRKGLTGRQQGRVATPCRVPEERAGLGRAGSGAIPINRAQRALTKFGLKRADTVKHELMALGVPEAAIRTVSLGEEGALCLDNSDVCRRMNRRVHLELRKIGLEHMVLAPLATEAMTESLSENLERSTEPGLAESIATSLRPSSDADHAAATLESSTGN